MREPSARGCAAPVSALNNGSSLEHELSYGPPPPPGHGPTGPPAQPPPHPGPYPYGPPQGPPGPPGYQGGPAWGGPPQPPGHHGGPAGKKSKRGVVIAVVAVLVMAAGGAGAWSFWLKDDSAGDVGFAPGTDKQLSMALEERFPEDWEPDASTARASLGSWLDGRWWTEKHFVREMWNEIVAYDLADGSVAWRVPVDGNGACKASRDVSPEGYVAVLRGEPATTESGPRPCDRLTIVDVNKGEEVWTSDIEPGVASVLPDVGDRPVIWGETVLIPGQGQTNFDLKSGTQKDPKDRGCWNAAFAVFGDTLITRQCGALVGFGRDSEHLWTWEHPGDDETSLTVLSADPLVVVVKSRDDEQVVRVEPGDPDDRDDPGEHTVIAEMDARSLDPMPPCGYGGGDSTELHTCHKAVVGAGVLYLKYAMDPNYRQVGIVAFDLTSGKELWRARADGELSLAPVGTDGDGRLIAFQPQDPPLGDYEGSRGAVVALDPETGEVTPLAGLPIADSGDQKWLLANNSLEGDIEWRDGRLVIVSPGPTVVGDSAPGGAGSYATVIYS